MKCAVAIVLALIGMSLAHPHPSGLSGIAYSPLLLSPLVEARSSVINHGVTIPVIKPIIKPIIIKPVIPIIKPVIPIVKSIYGGYGGYLH